MFRFRRFGLFVLLLLIIACARSDVLRVMPSELVPIHNNELLISNKCFSNENDLEGSTTNNRGLTLHSLPQEDAIANGSSATEKLTVMDVKGMVLDKATGGPKAGAGILLNGTDLQITDSYGRFGFTAVTPPYSLTVKIDNEIFEYHGLTRSNLQLPSSIGYQATIKGNVSASRYPLNANEFIGIALSRPAFGFGSVNKESGHFFSNVIWGKAPMITADVVAVHMKLQGILPESYVGKGKYTSLSLISGSCAEDLSITLTEPLPVSKTALSYDLGAYSTGSGSLFSITIDGATLPLRGLGPYPSGVILRLPSEGASLMVKGSDAKGNSTFVVTPAVLGGVTQVTFPTATVLKNSLPLDRAVGVSKMPTLVWTPVDEANLYIVTLENPKLSTRYKWYLPSGNTLTIPDYSLLGATLTGHTTYIWEVLAIHGKGPSVDTLTDPTGINFEFMLLSNPDMTFYSSAVTSFTTVP